MRTVISLLVCFALLAFATTTPASDTLFPTSLALHVVPPAAVPNSPTDVYTQDVWLQAIELVPQSNTSPTCTVQDKTAGTPIIVYNAVALSPNHTYRDERLVAPWFMKGGITWSCSDNTVMAQLTVKY